MAKKHSKQASGKDRNMAMKKRLVKKYDGKAARRNLENERERAYFAGQVSFDVGTRQPECGKLRCGVYCICLETGEVYREIEERDMAYARLHFDPFVVCIWDVQERVYVYFNSDTGCEVRLSHRI